jgi:hypothetical protein
MCVTHPPMRILKALPDAFLYEADGAGEGNQNGIGAIRA